MLVLNKKIYFASLFSFALGILSIAIISTLVNSGDQLQGKLPSVHFASDAEIKTQTIRSETAETLESRSENQPEKFIPEPSIPSRILQFIEDAFPEMIKNQESSE